MNIGKRLRQIRLNRGLSQGDIEKRTGIFRCYVSRVETGHIVPMLPMLENWAKSMGVPLYEVFIEEKSRDKAAISLPVTPFEKQLFLLLQRTDSKSRRLFLSVATTLAKQV